MLTVGFAFALMGVAFLVTTLVYPHVLSFAINHHIVDNPNARKLQRVPVPVMGGTTVFIGLLVAVIIGCVFALSSVVVKIMALLFVMYLLGVWDDVKDVPAALRFAAEMFVVWMMMLLLGVGINDFHGLWGLYEIEDLVSIPLSLIAGVGIMNAINLIDGIDGLASGLAFLILASFSYLYFNLKAYLFSLISISLAGAILAFFFFNMYGKVGRLKTFMGDSGSLFLGYVIAYLAIKYQMHDEPNGFPYREESLLISFTLVFLPCIDVIRVAIQRKLRGKNMFEADKTHIHHRIMQIGLDMHQTLAVILTVFFSICLINYGLYVGGLQTTYIIGIDILIYTVFIWIVERMKAEIS